jgi:hypothetical protein
MTINAPTEIISSSSDIRYLRRLIYGIVTTVSIYELPLHLIKKQMGMHYFLKKKHSSHSPEKQREKPYASFIPCHRGD